MRRWLATSTATEEVRECDTEPRDPVCKECGAEPEDGHEVWCQWHPDYYEPDVKEIPCVGDEEQG